MLTKGVVLLHDVRPHTAARTQNFVDYIGWDVINSPDLARSDFQLFLRLKQHLGGKHFDDDKEVKVAVENRWQNFM